jgi:hypothetical protein
MARKFWWYRGGEWIRRSLIDDTTGILFSSLSENNILNQPALLGPLADNGGSTLSHALLPGSPAIDAGELPNRRGGDFEGGFGQFARLGNTSISNEWAFTGNQSARLAGNAGGGSKIWINNLQKLWAYAYAPNVLDVADLLPGSEVVASVSALIDEPLAPGQFGELAIRFFKEEHVSQTLISEVRITTADEFTVPGEWNRFELTAPVPPGALRAVIELTYEGESNAIYYDDAYYSDLRAILSEFDVRGPSFYRFENGRHDLGSYEYRHDPPVFTSPAAVEVAENTSVVQTLTAVNAGASVPPFTFAIANRGADDALFEIVGDELRFISPPDFEDPQDFDRNNEYRVNVQVTDAIGGVTHQRILVSVTDVDEVLVASAGGPYIVEEGSTFLLDGSDSTDPNGPNSALTFEWDLDYDGITFHVDATGEIPEVSFADNFATRTIALRVTDSAGASDIATTTLTVNNVAPTITGITAPTAGVRNEPLEFQVAASDPSPVDDAAGFTYFIDWGDESDPDGDGVIGETVVGSNLVNLQRSFESNGTYVVTVTATDKDGATSVVATHTIEISAAFIDDNGNLKAGAEAGGGGVSAKKGSITLEFFDANGNFVEQFTFDESHVTGSLIIYGSPGDDVLIVDGEITLPVELYGGAGDDILVGGGGTNLIVGGEGNDTLIGGTGTNILDGGDGDNVLQDGGGTNTMIVGTGNNTLIDGGGTNTFEAAASSGTESADPPRIIVAPVATGNENAAIPLTIWAGLADTDGSETLSLQITGVPEFATLSTGTKNADGSWTITTDETSINLTGMSITALESGVFTLTVAATATEIANGTVSTTSASIEVNVLNVVNLSGRVFDDLNNDGVFDVGESGLANVGIELVRESDSIVVAATTTAADGTYEFDFGALGIPAGIYTIRQQTQPEGYLDGKESTGDLGGAAADNGSVINNADSNAITGIVIREPGTQQDTAGYDFAEIRPSSLQGLVWVDFNDDGEVDFGETAIEGVEITLGGTDDRGNAVSLTQFTDGQGIFEFVDLRPGTYAISQAQPSGFIDGKDVVGQVNGTLTGDNDGGTPALSTTNDVFTNVILAAPDSIGINYNFGERVDGGTLGSGQTASIGFWQNRNGRRLIESLNGSPESTLLAQYLSESFSNIYGRLADANGDGIPGDYMTNVEVADLYQDLFKRNGRSAPGGPPKLDAQLMAVAMSTYITKQSFVEVDFATNTLDAALVLGVESYGFVVTVGGVGSTFVNVGDKGAAFGVADNSDVQVIDLLLAVNDWSWDGLLYDRNSDGEIDEEEELYRILANDIFSMINEM